MKYTNEYAPEVELRTTIEILRKGEWLMEVPVAVGYWHEHCASLDYIDLSRLADLKSIYGETVINNILALFN